MKKLGMTFVFLIQLMVPHLASAGESVLYKCNQFQLKYEKAPFPKVEWWIDGLDIRSRFWLEDTEKGKTYPVEVTRLSSEGGNFIAKDENGDVFVTFRRIYGDEPRFAILKTGEQIECEFYRSH